MEARERTDGRFNPTIHDALVVAGHDRSCELLADAGPFASPDGPARADGRVAARGRRLTLDEGVRLDLDGIAKGHDAGGRTLVALLPNRPGDVAALRRELATAAPRAA